jgi:hypothetical protein
VRKLFCGKESADQREGREPLSKAKEIAEDWYLQLRGKLRAGEIKSEKTFREVSEQYLHEYDIWLDRLPDFSEPCRSSPKISHRAWFSPEEYKKLYEATRKRAQEPKLDRDKLLLYAQKYPRPVKRPATPRATLPRNPHRAKTRQEIAKWMEKELKKRGEAIFGPRRNSTSGNSPLRKRPAQQSGKANGFGESRSRSNSADSHLL